MQQDAIWTVETPKFGSPRTIGQGELMFGLDQALRIQRDPRCSHSRCGHGAASRLVFAATCSR